MKIRASSGSDTAHGGPQNFPWRISPRTRSMRPKIEGKSVVLAGRASKATNVQVAEWRASMPSFRIDPIALSCGEPVVEQAADFA